MIDDKGRTCNKCGVYKEFKFFDTIKYRKATHKACCKACCAIDRKAYYKNNRDRIRKQQSEYYQKLKEEYILKEEEQCLNPIT